jgi:hypothetical protein
MSIEDEEEARHQAIMEEEECKKSNMHIKICL